MPDARFAISQFVSSGHNAGNNSYGASSPGWSAPAEFPVSRSPELLRRPGHEGSLVYTGVALGRNTIWGELLDVVDLAVDVLCYGGYLFAPSD